MKTEQLARLRLPKIGSGIHMSDLRDASTPEMSAKIPSSSRGVLVGFGGLIVLGDEWTTESESMFFTAPKGLDTNSEKKERSGLDVHELILQRARASKEVDDVGPLFEGSTGPILEEGFQPIFLSCSIAASSRESTTLIQALFPHAQEIQKFSLAYDGRVVMYATEIDVDAPYSTWSLIEARQKFDEIIRDLDPVSIPPNLANGAIMATDSKDQLATKEEGLLFMTLRPEDSVTDILRRVYVLFHLELWTFYEACKWKTKADEMIRSVDESQRNLLDLLGDYLATEWSAIYTRFNMLGELHRREVVVLRNITQFLEYRDLAKYSQDYVKRLIERSTPFEKIMDSSRWVDYTQVEAFDLEHVTRILEHVRSEAQTYLTSWSTYLAALGGAVIGTLLTLALTHFFR